MNPTLPDPASVGSRAAEIRAIVKADPEYKRLANSTTLYSSCWSTFTGYPIVSNWDLDTDTADLFEEALKTLAMKAAVYEFTGDEDAAELMVSAPVDEMVHAVIAQFTVLCRIQDRTGLTFVHMTDAERFGWEPGDYTSLIYAAAGWDTPPQRYWIGAAETRRRLGILAERYRSIGIRMSGRSHDIDFEAEQSVSVAS